MALQLYDLAAAEPERRFSPYCWRAKLALARKGLAVETIPWRFTDKSAIAFSGQGRVPVLVDGDRVVSDSWAIATYLEQAYPDRPSLFGGRCAVALSRFINCWADGVLIPAMARLLAVDIFAHLHEKDRVYFRASREQRFGMNLEEASANRESNVEGFRKSLEPMRAMLGTQAYFGGNEPAYADYIVFGLLQWARCISEFQLLTRDDPIAAWRDRSLDAFAGLVRSSLGYDSPLSIGR
jgi:glutathione S-transferase